MTNPDGILVVQYTIIAKTPQPSAVCKYLLGFCCRCCSYTAHFSAHSVFCLPSRCTYIANKYQLSQTSTRANTKRTAPQTITADLLRGRIKDIEEGQPKLPQMGASHLHFTACHLGCLWHNARTNAEAQRFHAMSRDPERTQVIVNTN